MDAPLKLIFLFFKTTLFPGVLKKCSIKQKFPNCLKPGDIKLRDFQETKRIGGEPLK